MGTKHAAGFGDIGEAIADAQSNQQVIEDSHVVACDTDSKPGTIFMEGDISPIMQSTLDTPILAGQSQQLSW